MKKLGILAAAAVVALTAYNTWQISRLAVLVDRRPAEPPRPSTTARLELALQHARRARALLGRNETQQASQELDQAIRDVSVAATRSQRNERSLVHSMRRGLGRAGQRVRSAFKKEEKKKEKRA